MWRWIRGLVGWLVSAAGFDAGNSHPGGVWDRVSLEDELRDGEVVVRVWVGVLGELFGVLIAMILEDIIHDIT